METANLCADTCQPLTEQQQNCVKCDTNQKQRLFVFKIKGPPSDPCWLQHWGTAFTLKVSNFHSVCVLCANYRWHWQSSSYQRMHKGMLELPNGLLACVIGALVRSFSTTCGQNSFNAPWYWLCACVKLSWGKWTPFCFNIAGEKSGLNDPEISRHGIDWFEIFLTEG